MSSNLPVVIAEPMDEVREPRRPALPIAQADNDRHLVAMWIDRHTSPHTRRNYRRRAEGFLRFLGRPLGEARLGDLQNYLATLQGQSSASRANAAAALKSLFSFAQELGYTRFNIGKALKAPPVKNTLAERILDQADVLRMISMEPSPRNRAVLTMLYGGGLRISELCGLCWRDLAAREGGGQATVFGKGGKTRVILLSGPTWRLLQKMRAGSGAEPQSPHGDDPVFLSRQGAGRLTSAQVHRIVKAAAVRAELSPDVSAHWLRHAHASHNLDRGTPIHLVQATLGHASVATTSRYLHARPTDSSALHLGV